MASPVVLIRRQSPPNALPLLCRLLATITMEEEEEELQ